MLGMHSLSSVPGRSSQGLLSCQIELGPNYGFADHIDHLLVVFLVPRKQISVIIINSCSIVENVLIPQTQLY